MAEQKKTVVATVRSIRRATRKKYTAEEKVRIVVARNRSPLFRAQTLAHELAHALLHSDKDYRAHTPRSRIECEAESVSFCIMHHFGLDVGELAFGYLAHWGDGENALAELLECGERIRDAAHQVIAWIDEQYADTT